MSLLRSRTVRILTLALTVAAAAAACTPAANGLPTASGLPTALPGASAAAPAAAAAGPSEAVASGAVPSGASTDPAQAWPAFAACLRAHGANVADPVLDKNGDPQWAGEIKQFMTEPVRAACQPIIAGLEGQKDGRNRPAFTLESELAFAACIREHGFPTWPDPVSTTDAGRMPEGFDKQDPAVFAALEACNSVLVEMTASPSPAL
jgi:hypothetical protein